MPLHRQVPRPVEVQAAYFGGVLGQRGRDYYFEDPGHPVPEGTDHVREPVLVCLPEQTVRFVHYLSSLQSSNLLLDILSLPGFCHGSAMDLPGFCHDSARTYHAFARVCAGAGHGEMKC
jgi:hypothetical protein